jgi:hypothetical protein
LRKRRLQLAKDAETARNTASRAANELVLAEERTRQSKLALDGALAERDAALTGFPGGVDWALVSARAILERVNAEKKSVNDELTSLDRSIEARKQRVDDALSVARANAEQTKIAVEDAQGKRNSAQTNHASQCGQLIELQRLRDAENLPEAEARLEDALRRDAALPVPERIVTDEELGAARANERATRLELGAIEGEIQRAHGALEQVGGAVARERLRDATEAFALAERQEMETEAEYEAWKLLLEQMKEADAAQASNLGQALVPGIAAQFKELTQQRYQTVQLTAHLGTEGVISSGALRPAAQISVGTREQLSTLYRIALAEYLRTVIVLDDQLVQSDDSRMDWFRALLVERAQSFQIIVLTCRPGDYLPANALVPEGSAFHTDTQGGLIRAVDLGRALHRR